jgi:hypothetical protein
MLEPINAGLPYRIQLDQYEKLYELPLTQLLEELKLRYWLLTGHLYGCAYPVAIESYWKQFLSFWALRIASGKVCGTDYGKYMPEAHLPFLMSAESCSADNSALLDRGYSSIRIPSHSEIKQIRKSWLKSLLTDAVRVMRTGRKDLALKYLEDVLPSPVTTERGTVLLEIDLMTPSKQLKRDFSELLSQLKSEPIFDKRVDSMKSPERLRILRHRKIFEQLDIRLIKRVKRIEISLADTARILFPEQEKNFDDFYKRFPRDYDGEATKVCDLLFIKQLEALVASGVLRVS